MPGRVLETEYALRVQPIGGGRRRTGPGCRALLAMRVESVFSIGGTVDPREPDRVLLDTGVHKGVGHLSPGALVCQRPVRMELPCAAGGNVASVLGVKWLGAE